MIILDLHLHVGIRQQAHVIEQTPCRNCSTAGLLDARGAGDADAELQVCSREDDFIAISLDQNVRQNWNRCLLLNDALREVQFANQICPTDGKFHVWLYSLFSGRYSLEKKKIYRDC